MVLLTPTVAGRVTFDTALISPSLTHDGVIQIRRWHPEGRACSGLARPLLLRMQHDRQIPIYESGFVNTSGGEIFRDV